MLGRARPHRSSNHDSNRSPCLRSRLSSVCHSPEGYSDFRGFFKPECSKVWTTIEPPLNHPWVTSGFAPNGNFFSWEFHRKKWPTDCCRGTFPGCSKAAPAEKDPPGRDVDARNPQASRMGLWVPLCAPGYPSCSHPIISDQSLSLAVSLAVGDVNCAIFEMIMAHNQLLNGKPTARGCTLHGQSYKHSTCTWTIFLDQAVNQRTPRVSNKSIYPGWLGIPQVGIFENPPWVGGGRYLWNL